MNPTQDFGFIKSRVIPVLVIEDASWSLDLASTLVEAGLPIVEVTLRTKASWDFNLAQYLGCNYGVRQDSGMVAGSLRLFLV
jgi:hypothetical protein